MTQRFPDGASMLFQGVPGVADKSDQVATATHGQYGRQAAARRARPTDKLREECGVVAVHGHPDAARQAYLGLYALQHRGQESAGIATANGLHLANIKGMGLVSEIFTDDVLRKLPGTMAIGHTRYSTTGDSALLNAQPIRVESTKGLIAIAHNGNLVNLGNVRARLEHDGAYFQTTSDSEIIVQLIAHSDRHTLVDCIAVARIGATGGDRLEISVDRQPLISAPLIELRDLWAHALEAALHDEVTGSPSASPMAASPIPIPSAGPVSGGLVHLQASSSALSFICALPRQLERCPRQCHHARHRPRFRDRRCGLPHRCLNARFGAGCRQLLRLRRRAGARLSLLHALPLAGPHARSPRSPCPRPLRHLRAHRGNVYALHSRLAPRTSGMGSLCCGLGAGGGVCLYI